VMVGAVDLKEACVGSQVCRNGASVQP
jgi:hypothetical protein